jgi:hypothetical protein
MVHNGEENEANKRKAQHQKAQREEAIILQTLRNKESEDDNLHSLFISPTTQILYFLKFLLDYMAKKRYFQSNLNGDNNTRGIKVYRDGYRERLGNCHHKSEQDRDHAFRDQPSQIRTRSRSFIFPPRFRKSQESVQDRGTSTLTYDQNI